MVLASWADEPSASARTLISSPRFMAGGVIMRANCPPPITPTRGVCLAIQSLTCLLLLYWRLNCCSQAVNFNRNHLVLRNTTDYKGFLAINNNADAAALGELNIFDLGQAYLLALLTKQA